MRLKTNEQITQEFEKEENEKFKLLQSDIVDITIKLRKLQKKHKLLTGKNYVLDVI